MNIQNWHEAQKPKKRTPLTEINGFGYNYNDAKTVRGFDRDLGDRTNKMKEIYLLLGLEGKYGQHEIEYFIDLRENNESTRLRAYTQDHFAEAIVYNDKSVIVIFVDDGAGIRRQTVYSPTGEIEAYASHKDEEGGYGPFELYYKEVKQHENCEYTWKKYESLYTLAYSLLTRPPTTEPKAKPLVLKS